MIPVINDIHTHDKYRDNAIVSLSLHDYTPIPTHYYSLGIHPWNSLDTTSKDIELLETFVSDKQVIAIGETGIDRLKGGDLEKQTHLFEQHIILSEKYRKPLIIHAVHAIDIILSLHRRHNPTQQWIIHGFRGNETLARQLTDKNINISFGEKYNPKSVEKTPIEKLWIESDESTADIITTYSKIAQIKNISVENLLQSVTSRAAQIFFRV